MTINTLPLRKYQRFLESVIERGNQQYESVCIDTRSKKLRFSTSRVKGTLNLDATISDAEQAYPLIYLDTVLFLTLVREYPSLDMDDKYVFSPTDKVSDSTFNLAPLIEDFEEASDFSSDGFEFQELDLSNRDPSSLMGYLTSAASFAAVDPGSPYRGVFLEDGRVIGSDRQMFYERHLTDPVSQAFGLPLWCLDLIKTIPFDVIRIGLKNAVFQIAADDEDFVFQMTTSNSLSTPPVTNPAFIQAYTFPSGLIVSRQELLDQLKFFKPFVKYSPNLRVELTVEQDRLLIRSVSSTTYSSKDAKRRFPIRLSDAGLVGLTFQVNLDYLSKVVGTLTTDNIQLLTSVNSFVINLVGLVSSGQAGDQSLVPDHNFHVILTKLKA